MKIKNGLEKIAGIERGSILSQFKDLLFKLAELDVEIVDLEGLFVLLPCKIKGQKTDTCVYYIKSDCKALISEILDEVRVTRASRAFVCPAGMKKIIAPLGLNGTILGVLFAGENGSFSFNGDSLDNISKLLHSIANYIVKNEISFFNYLKPGTKTYKELLLEKTKRYIEENCHNPELSLHDVAKDNNVGYYYLSHLFRKELDTTFVNYRNSVRMEMAAVLLRDPGLTIDQISYKCGFEDSSYFSKVFKMLHRCTPFDFRKKAVKNNNKKKIAPLSSRLMHN